MGKDVAMNTKENQLPPYHYENNIFATPFGIRTTLKDAIDICNINLKDCSHMQYIAQYRFLQRKLEELIEEYDYLFD